MILSKSCKYAIRASLLLASKISKDRRLVPVHELSGELDVSFHFLTKILQILTQAGIMESLRGPHGGVGLARPLESIRLIDIIAAVDGMAVFESCVLGLSGCGTEQPCPVHEQWSGVSAQVRTIFETSTLASMGAHLDRFRI